MLDTPALLDTSVIIRYLTNDIPDLAARARALIASEIQLGITTLAILEAAYVLGRPPYLHPYSAIIDGFVELTRRENVVGIGIDIEHLTIALLQCQRESPPSFGDALLAATARSAGIHEVYSFDQRFERTGMRVVPMPH